MRLWKCGAAALTLGLSISLVTLTGCSGGGSPTTPPSGGGEKKDKKDGDDKKTGHDDKKDKKEGGGDKKGKTALTAGKGVIKGKVTLASAPDVEKLNEELKGKMEKQEDKAHCLAAKAGPDRDQQMWVVSKDKGLKNVVVFLVPEKGTFFACSPDDEAVKKVKDKAAEIHQPFCAFHPHVSVHFPVYRDAKNEEQKTGQKITIFNDTDKAEGGKAGGISHNTKWGSSTEGQTTGNETIKPGGMVDITNAIPSRTEPITFACSIHGWMNAYMFVLDNPYFAVTDADGNYEIRNVPKGKVKIVVWHEGVPDNYINEGGKDGLTVEVNDDEVKKDFTAKTK
jgi:hypothetical protein